VPVVQPQVQQVGGPPPVPPPAVPQAVAQQPLAAQQPGVVPPPLVPQAPVQPPAAMQPAAVLVNAAPQQAAPQANNLMDSQQVMQMMNAMFDRMQLNKQPAAIASSNALLMIPTFSGENASEDIEALIKPFSAFAKLENWTPLNAYEILRLKTERTAHTIVLNWSAEIKSCVQSMIAALRKRFKDKRTFEAIDRELVAVEQGPYESVIQYHSRVVELRRRLLAVTKNEQLPDGMLYSPQALERRCAIYFIDGLKYSLVKGVRDKMRDNPFPTMEKALELALYEEESVKLMARREPYGRGNAAMAAVSMRDDRPPNNGSYGRNNGDSGNDYRSNNGNNGHNNGNFNGGNDSGNGYERRAQSNYRGNNYSPNYRGNYGRPARGNGHQQSGQQRDNGPNPRYRCYHCDVAGHYASSCPNLMCGFCKENGHRPRDCPAKNGPPAPPPPVAPPVAQQPQGNEASGGQ
jgi:hypothetical protein